MSDITDPIQPFNQGEQYRPSFIGKLNWIASIVNRFRALEERLIELICRADDGCNNKQDGIWLIIEINPIQISPNRYQYKGHASIWNPTLHRRESSEDTNYFDGDLYNALEYTNTATKVLGGLDVGYLGNGQLVTMLPIQGNEPVKVRHVQGRDWEFVRGNVIEVECNAPPP